MQKNSISYFLIFLLLSTLIFSFSKLGFLEVPQSLLSKASLTITSPIFNFGSFLIRFGQNDEEKKLKDENLSLQKKLVDRQKLVDENKALHDQFETTASQSLRLLPAKVVGSSSFVPGVFSPDSFILDKGSDDGVKIAQAVIVKDNLIGKITKTTKFLSEVTLITNPQLKFAAKTINGSGGVVKGEGNGDLILDNVLLSDHLKKGDLVVTFGDIKIDAGGVPPNVIIGEVVSVEGSSSDLFQQAKLKTLIDLSKITETFVFLGLR